MVTKSMIPITDDRSLWQRRHDDYWAIHNLRCRENDLNYEVRSSINPLTYVMVTGLTLLTIPITFGLSLFTGVGLAGEMMYGGITAAQERRSVRNRIVQLKEIGFEDSPTIGFTFSEDFLRL